MFKIFIAIPILISVFFAFKLFITSKSKGIPYKFLAVFYSLFSVILVAMLLVSETHNSEQPNAFVDLFSLLFYVAIISLPQTFYFYIISLSDHSNNKLKREDILKHYYLPVILLIINVFSFFYLKYETNENSNVYEVSVNVMNYSNFLALLFIFPILNCFYIFKAIKTYKKHKKNVAEFFSYQQGVDLNWMLQYITGYCIFIIIIYVLQVYSNVLSVSVFTGVFLLVYLLYIGIKGSSQQQVMFEKELTATEADKNSINEVSIQPEIIEEIKQKIIEKIVEEPYLDKSLTIHQFSKSLGSNSKYVSMVLNSEFKQNFATFINFYRIEKAKQLLVSDLSSKYTIETISETVGFRSKSAFNKAFKNIEGVTPSEFKKANL